VVIRCERCSTMYELDEALLSAAGSPVQCTRCQHVFTAFPPGAGARALVEVPPASAAPEAPPPAVEPVRPAPPPPRRATAGASASAAASIGAAPAPRSEAPRVPRSGPPPVYRPSTPAPGPGAPAGAGVGRGPLLRRDTVGAFEARLRWSARLKWLVPGAAALLLAAIAGGAWLLLSRRPDPKAARARLEAMALVARDDAASVERAVGQLDDALRRAPELRGAAADRALAQVVLAAALSEAGDEPRARVLAAEAVEALRRLRSTEGNAPEIARALAAYHALGGDRVRALEAVRAGRERAPADAWLDLAEAWVDARAQDQEARERALVELGALSTAHPELLRARYLLARTQAALGRNEEALASLAALLAANPAHAPGKRLQDELSAALAPGAPSPAAPPAENAPAPSRNAASQPAPAAPVQASPDAPPRVARPRAAPAPAVAPPVPAAPVPPATVEPEAPAPVEPSPAPPAPAAPEGGGAAGEAPAEASPPALVPAPARLPRGADPETPASYGG
jgi:predicted Zn finger-like uncharacterized protein